MQILIQHGHVLAPKWLFLTIALFDFNCVAISPNADVILMSAGLIINQAKTPHPLLLAHLRQRLKGELIVYQSSRRPSVCVFTLSNMNISEANGSIATKFYLKHHWGGGKAALGFGPDQIRTLVSMATESSHRVIMEETVSPLFVGCFSSDPCHTCR